MVIDRRDLLKATALTFGSVFAFGMEPWSPLSRGAVAGDLDEYLVAACRRADGSFALVVMTSGGQIQREFPLSARGHDFAYHRASGSVVAFARRPGRFALVFNARNKSPPVLFAPTGQRHFYGHGTFSNDGRLLYATENDFESARGVIGVYDAGAGFKRVGELPSHGVGPHDILLLRDGKTLVVANGGIETHPETGRQKLNITTMKPSLCFVDIASGDLVVRHELPSELHHLSIRHLTSDNSGNVWFGGQWQGGVDHVPGLVGRARMDAPLEILDGAKALGGALKGYVGSVAMSADGRWLAASAPRAGRVVFFDTENTGAVHTKIVADGCGLAPVGESRFAVSSGHGLLVREMPTDEPVGSRTSLGVATTVPGVAFDNHMRAIS